MPRDRKQLMRKLLIAVVAVLLVASIATFVWVRSVFTGDTVRDALASQIGAALGQPVSVTAISAGIYPRVTVTLEGVSIGQPVRIRVERLRLGTGLRALLSREIVGGTVHLDGARLELPLPPLGGSTPAGQPPAPAGDPVLRIVSIDEIALNDVEVVSGGRSLRGTIVATPHGNGATIRSVALAAEDTRITGSGEITDLAGPVGTLAIEADSLNVLRLADFLTSFVAGAGLAPAAAAPSPAPGAEATAARPDFTVALETGKAVVGPLTLDGLKGRARITADAVAFQPVEFGVFDGRYRGGMTLTTGDTPAFRLRADVSNLDVAALTAFAGTPGVVTGRMTGRVDLAGRGIDPGTAMESLQGTARVDATNGTIKRLGLVRTVVVATSMRSGAPAGAAASGDESFSALGATLAIAGGTARTSDLQFQSPDVLMHASGSLRLDGSAVNLAGQVQLSEALSQQAGRDLVRYTQEGGRVTLPVTVTGPAQALAVRVDVADAAKRAIRNKAQEEIKKGLERLFRRRPGAE
jgi:uncharacterized protein involved in outer membrane biogenesis